MLLVAAQVALGFAPHWHPYIAFVFFATLAEYNLHRLVTLWTNKEAAAAEKFNWVKTHLPLFYTTSFLSIAGLGISMFLIPIQLLISLSPMVLLTALYTLPILKWKGQVWRLRDVPYAKMFLIAVVWAMVTVYPVSMENGLRLYHPEVLLLLAERLLFVLAITLPFDVRDMAADKRAGTKTLPSLLSQAMTYRLASVFILLSGILAIIHYAELPSYGVLLATLVSLGIAGLLLVNQKIRQLPYYYYGLLDGTLLLQGVLVWVGYFILKGG